jgi:hypothetical protein
VSFGVSEVSPCKESDVCVSECIGSGRSLCQMQCRIGFQPVDLSVCRFVPPGACELFSSAEEGPEFELEFEFEFDFRNDCEVWRRVLTRSNVDFWHQSTDRVPDIALFALHVSSRQISPSQISNPFRSGIELELELALELSSLLLPLAQPDLPKHLGQGGSLLTSITRNALVPPTTPVAQSTISTGVPRSTLLKKISAILPGIRMHPCDAG